jgi:hypothetical protein
VNKKKKKRNKRRRTMETTKMAIIKRKRKVKVIIRKRVKKEVMIPISLGSLLKMRTRRPRLISREERVDQRAQVTRKIRNDNSLFSLK